MLMPGLLSELLADATAKSQDDPLAPKEPHFPAKAKRVIFVFSNGGVSHMDTFDYKPELFKADDKHWEIILENSISVANQVRESGDIPKGMTRRKVASQTWI